MTDIRKLFDGIPKQQAAIDSLLGLSTLKSLTWRLGPEESGYHGLKGLESLNSLTGLSAIAKSFARGMPPSLADQIQRAMPSALPLNPLSSLTNSLSRIAQLNPSIANSLKDFGHSQLLLSQSFDHIAKIYQFKHNGLSSLDFTLNGLSNSFIREASFSGRWQDVLVAQEANEAAVLAAEELIQVEVISKEAIIKFHKKYKQLLLELLSKYSESTARILIIDFIAVVSLFMGAYSMMDNGKSAQMNRLTQTVVSLQREVSELTESGFAPALKYRVASTNVRLRFSPNKRAKQIGLVREGQMVMILGTQHKYFLVAFIDDLSGEPRSGYVMKKYFDVVEVQ